ncbi:MAG: AAA family ATPase [Candidatus Babeliales bacterium]
MSRHFSFIVICGGIILQATLVHAHQRMVISGGPGIGKTTVLKELRKRGYQTISETFTSLFEQAATQDALDVFFNGPKQLEMLFLTEQVRKESLLAPQLPAFLDRSVVDIMAYGYYLHVPISDEMLRLSDRKYDLVFFLEPLPEEYYRNSSVRRESREVALDIHQMLKAAYMQRGYYPHQMIDVPFGTPQERAQFIIDVMLERCFHIDVFDSFATQNASNKGIFLVNVLRFLSHMQVA